MALRREDDPVFEKFNAIIKKRASLTLDLKGKKWAKLTRDQKDTLLFRLLERAGLLDMDGNILS